MCGVRRTDGIRRLAASLLTVDSLTWRTCASCLAVKNSSRSSIYFLRHFEYGNPSVGEFDLQPQGRFILGWFIVEYADHDLNNKIRALELACSTTRRDTQLPHRSQHLY